MLIPIRFACCFYCSISAIKARVSDLLDDLPPEAWGAVRDRMLVPLLRRMAALDARMPSRWTDLAIPLPRCPLTDDPIGVRFWQLGRMVRTAHPNGGFFDTFNTLANAIMSQLAKSADTAPVCLQIALANNEDLVLHAVASVGASKRRRSRAHTVCDLTACNALEYAHALASNIRSFRPAVMRHFADQLQEAIDRWTYLRLIVMLGCSDTACPFSALSTDLMRMVNSYTHTEPVLLEDVLRDFVDHDMQVQV